MPVPRRTPTTATSPSPGSRNPTSPGLHVFVTGACVPPRSEGSPPAVPGAAIRVFLVSDFELLRQGLAGLMANRRGTFELVGWSASVDLRSAPWGTLKPDVLVLDLTLPAAPESIVGWVTAQVADSGLRVLLLGHPQRANLQNRALLAGARGVLERSCSYEQLLIALTHVHGGNMWLDSGSASQLLRSVRQPDGAGGGSPTQRALQRLSERERDILRALLKHAAAPAKTLAQQLSISESTLRNHLTSIYGKLGVRNRNGLLYHAMSHGLGQQLPEP